MAKPPDEVVRSIVQTEPMVDNERIDAAEKHIDEVLSNSEWTNENAALNGNNTFWIIESNEHKLTLTELGILVKRYKEAGWPVVFIQFCGGAPVASDEWTITLGIMIHGRTLMS